MIDATDDYDFLGKVILVGDQGTGKTSFSKMYFTKKFDSETKSTIGVEFSSEIFTIDDNKIKIQLWDTAGQERFEAITNLYYKNSIASIIFFDLTKLNTFYNVSKWIEKIKNNTFDCMIYLVGNKSDLEHVRAIKKTEAEEFAKANGALYFEVSVKNNINVTEIMHSIANSIVERISDKKEYINEQTECIKLVTTDSKTKEKNCCI